jgi:SAM-dependent methyltransferase
MSSDQSIRGDVPALHTVPGSELQSFTLESLASAVNYHAWLCDLVQPYLGDDPLEFGSGLGDYAATWVRRGQQRITVSDVDSTRRAVLLERFADNPRVTVRDLDVLAPYEAAHSSLVAINVLEHIEDDRGALASAHRLLRPGGKVVIFVPAFPFAMSRFDREAGHFRRYRRESLRQVFTAAGLRVERMHYVNAPGLVAWFIGMRLLRMTPQDGATVRLWDRRVVPVARAIESRVSPPFGQSLFAVGVAAR